MNRCPITLEPCGDDAYSASGLKKLSPKLNELLNFPYSRAEQLEQAAHHAAKMSIQGVQPKLSVRLNVPGKTFEIVDSGGTFIIKPPHMIFSELVENEDVTMRLARASNIAVPLSGMIYAKDKSLSYFVKRFDRIGHGHKLAVEDFAQLSEHTRDTKYDSSMETVAAVIEKFCAFPAVEKVRLLRLTIFNFLVGNEDMHLKNFSLITRDNKVELSPAYDLLNTTIVLNAQEELALPLMGKKSGLKRQHFIDYFAIERLKLPHNVATREISAFTNLFTIWNQILHNSFLSERTREKYLQVIDTRRAVLEI